MTSVLISPRHHEFAAACEQSGRRVFTWPELDEAELSEGGARVDCLAVYRTTLDARRMAELNALLAGGGIDAVIFHDSPSVEEFARVFDTDDLPRILRGVSVLCDDKGARATAAE